MTEQRNYSDKACKNLCGFFGTESNDGYCSVCYKEHLKEKEKKTESVAGRGGSPSSPTNRQQSLSSDCIISNSSGHVSTFPSDTGQPTATTSRVSPARKVSVSDVSCKIRQEVLPQSPRAQEVPPLSALKSGSGMPGYQETFEIPIEEEYEEDTDAFQEENRSVLQSCNERCQASSFSSDQSKCAEVSAEEQSISSEAEDTKRKGNRCGICNKKLGLTGFKCRCGGQFCSIHRYSDKHECSFDYKEYGQRQIRKNNPVVSGEKISKI